MKGQGCPDKGCHHYECGDSKNIIFIMCLPLLSLSTE
jgi:hypothetical protein